MLYAMTQSETGRSTIEPLARSPDLMSADDTGLLVIDVQEKLVGLISGHQRMLWNVRRLLDGAKALGVSAAATEQYPQGLGKTVPELAQRLGDIPDKVGFSCGACPEIFSHWDERGISRVLVAGIEAHVCVQQTVLDLLASGRRVYVAVDAVGSRYEIDYQTALRRMDSAGATLTTTEAALFEWCQRSGTPQFKEISRLVRETPPA
jgi:nicotinamidase-related amidase